ncbi:hypothetical protein B0H14DRAFT_2557324 [Mycena olivaceomarginata]|nr:hypothetical protein B0H14DRAFT_2557324 [Mycena olivaceomarginata]
MRWMSSNRTARTKLTLANEKKQFAAYLRELGRHEDALRADEVGSKIYGKAAQTDPGSAAEYLYYLAIDFHSIGLREDALHAEEQAVDLYSKQAGPKPTLLRLRIKAPGLLAKILRALRQEDALLVDAEVVTLKDMLIAKIESPR